MIIPSFKPAVSYKELNTILARALFGNASKEYASVFENKFARYLGVKHAIRVPSARWGLFYILQSLNLKEGDEVILPAFSYFAVPAAIVRSGLKPVFVDINSENLNINIQKIRENITQKTRVIIPTHLCGFVCALDEILDISRKHNIAVIEDCAQSLGAEYKGRKAGSWGEASYFSFGATKHFTTLGQGMIATSNDEMADTIRRSVKDVSPITKKALFFELLKAYIMKFATSQILFPAAHFIMKIFYFFDIDVVERIFRERETTLGDPPKDSQLDDIQAELGIAQLRDLDRKNESRSKNGLELYRMLSGAGNIRILSLECNAKNIFSTCPVLIKDKKNTRKILLKKGIDISTGYMKDCSRLDVFEKFKKYCPNASKAEEKVIYIPVYAELDFPDLIYAAETIKKVVK